MSVIYSLFKSTLCFVVVALCALADCQATEPVWLNPTTRARQFQAEDYYSGSWTQKVLKRDVDQATRDAVESARKELVRSIKSEIHLHTASRIETLDNDKGYSESEQFMQTAYENSSAMLVNACSETYIHPDKSMVSAFVYISKRDMNEYSIVEVEKGVKEVEAKFDRIKDMFNSGEKKLAYDESLLLKEKLSKIDLHLDMINCIGLDRAKYSSLSGLVTSLQNSVARFISDSDQAVRVYVMADERVGTRKVGFITGMLKEALTTNGCQIVDSPDDADYMLELTASTRKSSNGSGDVVYAYADVDTSLTNLRQNKRLYETQISKKGGALSFEKASRKALDSAGKELKQAIVEKLK